MTEEIQFIKSRIRIYTIIWISLAAELVIFFFITFFWLSPVEMQMSNSEVHISVLYLSYLISVVSIPAIYKIYDYRRKKIKKDADGKTKLETYFFTLLIKLAILETAAIISLAAFYLNEINEPLYMFGIVFIVVLLNKPSFSQFEKDFLMPLDENVIEEIVYMPDEFEKQSEDTENKNSEVK